MRGVCPSPTHPLLLPSSSPPHARKNTSRICLTGCWVIQLDSLKYEGIESGKTPLDSFTLIYIIPMLLGISKTYWINTHEIASLKCKKMAWGGGRAGQVKFSIYTRYIYLYHIRLNVCTVCIMLYAVLYTLYTVRAYIYWCQQPVWYLYLRCMFAQQKW